MDGHMKKSIFLVVQRYVIVKYGGWVVFWSSMSLELSFCLMKRHICSPVQQVFPHLNYKALILTRPWMIICLFLMLSPPTRAHRILSLYGSQLPPLGILLWIALQKVKIIASSPENLWSIVVTVTDSAFWCRFPGVSVKCCKVTVHFSKISALLKCFHCTWHTML